MGQRFFLRWLHAQMKRSLWLVGPRPEGSHTPKAATASAGLAASTAPLAAVMASRHLKGVPLVRKEKLVIKKESQLQPACHAVTADTRFVQQEDGEVHTFTPLLVHRRRLTGGRRRRSPAARYRST